jgi:hypothetical protein
MTPTGMVAMEWAGHAYPKKVGQKQDKHRQNELD